MKICYLQQLSMHTIQLYLKVKNNVDMFEGDNQVTISQLTCGDILDKISSDLAVKPSVYNSFAYYNIYWKMPNFVTGYKGAN